MEASAFKAWQKHVALKNREAAAVLGKSMATIARYRAEGVPETESVTVRLALRAVVNALPPWPSSIK
jgi:hypothetical protein